MERRLGRQVLGIPCGMAAATTMAMADTFNDQMQTTNELFSAGSYAQSLACAQALKDELMDQPMVDADRLGWPVYYELRCHYELGNTEQGWQLLHSDPFQLCQPNAKNRAWMCSVGAELAARLGRPEDVVAWGQECFWLRVRTGDDRSRRMCCDTVCTLLGRLGRADLNHGFAAELVRLGREQGSMDLALRGIGYLLDNLGTAAHGTAAQDRVGESVVEAFGELGWIGTEGCREEIEPLLARARSEAGLDVPLDQVSLPRRGPADRYRPYQEETAPLHVRAAARQIEGRDRGDPLTVQGFSELSLLLQRGFRRVGYSSHLLEDGVMYWLTNDHGAAIGRVLPRHLESFHLALTCLEDRGLDAICDACGEAIVDELTINHRSADEVTVQEASGLARLVTKLGCRKLSLWAYEHEPEALVTLAQGLADNCTLVETDLCDTSRPEPGDRIEVPAIEAIVARNRSR